MPFDNEFDIVHTNAVLQHNKLEEQEKILPKVNQALKHGGIFVIAESTVSKQTSTQRTYQGWITFIEKHGFSFMESWHKNELDLEDNYLFVKTKTIEKTEKQSNILENKNVTKEDLLQLLKHKTPKKEKEKYTLEDVGKDYYSDNPEIITSKSPTININTNNIENNDTIYMNEYWNLEDDTIPLLECIVIWKKLKVGEKCYFIYESNLSLDTHEFIKNIFNKVGFEYNGGEANYKIEFIKLSITKIRNWEYLRHIHELLNEI